MGTYLGNHVERERQKVRARRGQEEGKRRERKRKKISQVNWLLVVAG
jgi:hypothetical protein